MADAQVSTVRPLGISPLMGAFAILVLVVFGVMLAQWPTILLLLSLVVGLIIGFARPDLFVYFLLVTIVLNFAREMGGFPLAFEELKALAIPLIALHSLSGGKIVPRVRVKSVYLWPAIFLLAGAIVSYFRTESYGYYFRDAGRLLGRMACLWAVVNIATTWKRQRLLLQALLIGGLCLCGVGFFQVATRSYTPIYSFVRGEFYTPFSPTRSEEMVQFEGRAVGLSGPNETGCYLAVLLPFAMWSVLSSRRKLSSYLLLGTLSVGLFLSFSRGAIGGAVVGLLLFLGLTKRLSLRALVAMSVAALLIFLALSSDPVRDTLDLRIAGTADIGRSRLDLWATSWPLFTVHPIVGLGTGNVQGRMREVTGGLWSKNLLYVIDHPHNQYLDILLESGLIGLACYLWIFFRALQLGIWAANQEQLGPRRFEVTAFSCGVIVILVQGFVDTVISLSQVGYLSWALFGLVEATYLLVKSEARDRLTADSPAEKGRRNLARLAPLRMA